MEVERKRLQMLDGSCLQDLAKRCTEVGRKLLHMLDASCLQPLAERCTEAGGKRLQMRNACKLPPAVGGGMHRGYTPMCPAVGGIPSHWRDSFI